MAFGMSHPRSWPPLSVSWGSRLTSEKVRFLYVAQWVGKGKGKSIRVWLPLERSGMMGHRHETSRSTGNRRDRQGNTMAYREQWSERLAFYRMDVEQQHETFARDVAQGLAAPQKTLPAKYFYDARGSQLYEQI